MNEKIWEDCLSEGDATIVSKDKKKSESLIRTAKGRIMFFETQQIEENTANYIFEGYYTSIIELLHAIVIANGYKVSNHICIGYYLRDIMKRNDLFRLYDDLRYKRNSLVYYGKSMDFDTAKDAIAKSKRLIKELEKINNGSHR